MLASKQIAFGRGGKRKPYDAEIEYLESTGTQWIDTGISPVGADIEISFAFTGLGDNNLGNIFGAMAGDNAKDGVFLRSFRSLTILTGFYGAKHFCFGGYVAGFPTINITEGQKCTLSIKKGESIIINGTLYRSDLADAELTTLNSVYLFAAHVDAGLFRHGVGRVYGYKAIYADKILDLIPVRKGNIGYMYDRVSGQLFGNQGTGEFVLGPDIIDYTAKDYIQDGLVAMWDGIENVGWGVHDPNATVWKDLVGGMDIVSDTPLSDGVRHWDNDAFVFDAYQGRGLRGVPNEELKSAIEKCELTADSVFYANGTGANNSCVLQVSDGALMDGLVFAVINSTNFESSISDAWAVRRARVTLGTDWDFNYKKIYAAYKCDGGAGELLVNCDGMTSNTNTLSPPVSQGQLANSLYLGSYSWSGGRTRVFMGGIHSTRIYNRALTAEEIAHNSEIDKARFGL